VSSVVVVVAVELAPLVRALTRFFPFLSGTFLLGLLLFVKPFFSSFLSDDFNAVERFCRALLLSGEGASEGLSGVSGSSTESRL